MDYRSIWLATDLSDGCGPPFVHALALAMGLQLDLTVLHLHPGDKPDWSKLPDVRERLIRWGRIAPDAAEVDANELGFRIQRHALASGDERALLTNLVEANNPDLLVLGHRRSAWARLFEGSRASRLAQRAEGSTLVVPEDSRSLVGPDGEIRCRSILVPVGPKHSGRALRHAVRFCENLGLHGVEVVLGHIGPYSSMPELDIPDGYEVRTRVRLEGPVPAQLLDIAEGEDVDLIAMETHGHVDFWDELVGTRSDRVMNRSRVPLLLCRED